MRILKSITRTKKTQWGYTNEVLIDVERVEIYIDNNGQKYIIVDLQDGFYADNHDVDYAYQHLLRYGYADVRKFQHCYGVAEIKKGKR